MKVTRCNYLKTLRSNDPSVLDKFMEKGGWNIMFGWVNTAIADKNYALLKEIVNLLLITPVTIPRIRSNKMPIIIKSFSRECEDEETRNLCKHLVFRWISIAKSELKGETGGETIKVKSFGGDVTMTSGGREDAASTSGKGDTSVTTGEGTPSTVSEVDISKTSGEGGSSSGVGKNALVTGGEFTPSSVPGEDAAMTGGEGGPSSVVGAGASMTGGGRRPSPYSRSRNQFDLKNRKSNLARMKEPQKVMSNSPGNPGTSKMVIQQQESPSISAAAGPSSKLEEKMDDKIEKINSKKNVTVFEKKQMTSPVLLSTKPQELIRNEEPESGGEVHGDIVMEEDPIAPTEGNTKKLKSALVRVRPFFKKWKRVHFMEGHEIRIFKRDEEQFKEDEAMKRMNQNRNRLSTTDPNYQLALKLFGGR